MEQSVRNNSSARIYWLYFLIAFIIQIVLIVYLMEFFWITLPFVLAFLVRALGKM